MNLLNYFIMFSITMRLTMRLFILPNIEKYLWDYPLATMGKETKVTCLQE